MEKEIQRLYERVEKDTDRTEQGNIQGIGNKLLWIMDSNLSYNSFEIHITARAMYEVMNESSKFSNTGHLILGNDILELVYEHDDSVGFDIEDRDDNMAAHDYLDTYFEESGSEGHYDESRYYEYHFNGRGEPYFTILDIDTLVDLYDKMCDQTSDTVR